MTIDIYYIYIFTILLYVHYIFLLLLYISVVGISYYNWMSVQAFFAKLLFKNILFNLKICPWNNHFI